MAKDKAFSQNSIDPEKFIGRHLILDVQTYSIRGISEISIIYNLLEELSRRLDMTLAYPPIVGRFPWANNELARFTGDLKNEGVQAKTVEKMEELIMSRANDMAGVSGIAIWLESHAAIHTWTEDKFFSFDAYSCKDFDYKVALKIILQYFDVESYRGLDIIRTTNRPQKITSLKG
ncbi:MAG: S-adenosylmethionine decarboxylase [bacterium]